MWTRKHLKHQAKKSLKSNYQKMVSVCFLIAFLTTSFASSTSIFRQFRPGLQTIFVQTHLNFPDVSNSSIAADTLHHVFQISLSDSPLASLFEHMLNIYTSGRSFLFAALKAVNEAFHDPFSTSFFLLLLGVLLSFLYTVFIQNVLLIGEARFFLEARTYQKTTIGKLFFLYKVNFFSHPAWIMTCRCVFQTFWNLTFIGGIIKKYEYSMIPYILAENPTMGQKDAFFLSRQLMRGNKWRMFLLHLSFIGWSILSLLTFGILDFLFVNPYQTATDAELYMTLRKNYIRSRAPRYELFNDPLLEQELSDDELLIRKALYDDSEGPYTKIAYFEPHQYPAFLFSVQPPVRAVHQPMAPTASYHPLTLASLFFLFSILGWILETLSYLTMEGVFLNRSILLGPWIPLYGICGVLSVTMLHRFAKNPILAFCMNGLLYSVIGYLSDFTVQMIWHADLHKISQYFCPSLLPPFFADAMFLGLIGCACQYFIAPKWKQITRKIPLWFLLCVCVLLGMLMLLDVFFAFYR